MLHSDDLKVVVMREDSDGVTTRESDVGHWSSPLGFGKSLGYYVCNQPFSSVFSLGGTRTSITGKTSSYGINHEVYIILGHFQWKSVKGAMMMEGVS